MIAYFIELAASNDLAISSRYHGSTQRFLLYREGLGVAQWNPTDGEAGARDAMVEADREWSNWKKWVENHG